MIKVDHVDENGCIHFYSTENVKNVTIEVCDKTYTHPAFITHFNDVNSDGRYYVSLHHSIVYYLRNFYIRFISGDNVWEEPIIFPTELLKGYSLYGNSCVVWRTYEVYNTKYNTPTIGNLILDDEMFVKFCENLDTYLNAEMTFGEVRNNENFKKQTGYVRHRNSNTSIPHDYPVSYHDDIDIHWIHTNYIDLQFYASDDGGSIYRFDEMNRKPDSVFKEKWESRVKKGVGAERICIWAASEMFNVHGDWERKQLIERFKSLPYKSIFLTERKEEEFEDDMHVIHFVPEWEGRHQLERDPWGGLLWNDQMKNAHRFKDIINEKWNK
jgi:uncharacterized protein (DUF1919 family)